MYYPAVSFKAAKCGRKLLAVLAGLFLFAGCICLGLILVVNARSFYRLLLAPLRIASSSGFSKEEILLNYNRLIDYCSPFFHGELNFPTFCSSASAISHFAEVKEIFFCFYRILLLSGMLAACTLRFLHGGERRLALRCAGMFCLFAPVLLLAVFLAGFHGNFHLAFNAFHRLLFQNMDWLFNPATDPIILILPEQYFLCCGGLILLILLSLGFFLWKKGR